MRYGAFNDTHREYVITQPDTPLPWINYLGSQDFFGLISNTAGGYSFYRDARLRRLTRYRYNDAPFDTGGRFLYLRDNASADYWSPTWQPTRKDLEQYTCRHGMGYTCIQSTRQNIQVSTQFFIPLGTSIEVWQISVTNQRSTPADLTLFGAVEFCLWDAHDDATNFQRNFNTGEVEAAENVIYHKTEYRERRNHFAFLACSEPVQGFDTRREAFLGAYRGWDAPQAVELGACTGSIAHGWSPIGAQQVSLSLAAGETRQVIFLLGYHENSPDDKFDPPGSQTISKRSVQPIIAHYLQEQNVESAFADLRADWEQLLSTYQVQTPDPHTNRMVNIWNAYQCMITFNMSRSASYFESGIGRGMGFRDSNQDLLGFMQIIPERARERILDLAATQMESGGAYHQYQPLTKLGNLDVGSDFNDDPHWLVLSTAAYIKETGDWSILEELVPFENQPGSQRPLYEHLQRSIQYTRERLGPHGLPLIGRADWNDCLNLNCFSTAPGESFQTTTNKEGTVAESVFIGGLFVLSVSEMAEIAKRTRRDDEAVQYRQMAEEMSAVVVQHGWDGEWFRRAYDDFGELIGSQHCEEGQVFIEPQGMCVMAGIGLQDGKAVQALESVYTRLASPHGILLHQPAYTAYQLRLGEITTYPPGYKENGSVFCHTNPWVMIAETRLGNGERAFDYYQRINPSCRERISEIHRCEPYVYAQTIAGRDAPTQGEAKNSWLSGSAAWNYVAITQSILGVQPTWDGLQIDPCIPSEWDAFHVRRAYRGAIYDIEVRNPQHVCKGVLSVEVDGKNIWGNILPLFKVGESHRIVVILGKPS